MLVHPSTLDTPTLTARLVASAGEARDTLVDFLLYLGEFDAREAYREHASSIWNYCTRKLHLRAGAAGRRIGAARVLREFPALEEPLRDGRICLTTAFTLRSVLTPGNVSDVIERAAYLSDEDTAYLVASLRPKAPPKEGFRALPVPAPVRLALAPEPAAHAPPVSDQAPEEPSPSPAERPALRLEPGTRAEFEPCSATLLSFRFDTTPEFKADLQRLKELRSHAHPDGKPGALIHEAVRLALAHFGKARGFAAPDRPRTQSTASPTPANDTQLAPRVLGTRPAIPLSVKRAVYVRDGGRCTHVSKDGERCDCRSFLEFDHITPWADGGPSTLENLRLRCRTHNGLAAEERFGRAFMQERKRSPSTTTPPQGEFAIASDSTLGRVLG